MTSRQGACARGWWRRSTHRASVVAVVACLSHRRADGQTMGARPSLTYVVHGVDRCPTEATVRAQVRADFGYEFFASTAGEPAEVQPEMPAAVRVEASRVNRAVTATLRLTYPDGHEERQEFPVVAPAGCAQAMDQLLMRFNSLLHARLNRVASSGTRERRVEATAQRSEPVVQVVEAERPPPTATSTTTAPPPTPRRWHLELTLTGGVVAGAMPDPRPTVTVGAHFVHDRWMAGLEAAGDLPWTSPDAHNTWTLQRWTVAALGCSRWSWFGLCVVARGGVLLGAGTGLIDGTSGTTPDFGLGLRGVLRVPLPGAVSLVASAEGLASVVGGVFVAQPPGGGPAAPLWERGIGVFSATAGVSIRIW